MSAEFVHLHVHSEYSLLDGLPHPDQLAQRAQNLNQRAVALTDHGTMFAAIEFHDACLQEGVKPIIGLEAYLAPRGMKDRDPKVDRNAYHLLLLAEDERGYHNLMRLATAAQLEGFYYYPRVDKEILARYSEGIIATTGCLASEIPQLLAAGRRADARSTLQWYKDIFKERFYVELQDHGIPTLTQVNQELVSLAGEFNLKLIATNDAHYLNPEDWFAQDVLICIQTGTTVTATDRLRMDGHDYYFKSTEEMASVWSEFPDALKNTIEIAERCQLDLTARSYHLPYFPVPKGFDAGTYLRALCDQGLAARYRDSLSTEIEERYEYELSVIHRMGFDTYFLIVWDLTRYAKERGIWYNVRGSAASSIVAYCLGITNLDPLVHRLVFERFLNPGRISMPDIDLDFPDDARGDLIKYAVEKYGKENVAQIITFGRLLAKAAIRDVGRALDYPLTEVDRAAKLIPTGPGQTIEGALERIPEFRELVESSDYIRKLVDNARMLEGVARHASTHAAGVVIADKPIVEYTPLHRATRGGDTGFAVTQYPMGDLERIGLLKIDFLGLATLSIMRRACDIIEKRHGKRFDLSNIPVEDKEAFDLLSRGDVTGVFQVEGGGMRRVLIGMKPTKFDHIVATNALYRPGPMQYIQTYIRRMHGEEPVEYKHPQLEPILSETFGIIVYQEQIIQIAVQLAGYKPGEADEIRKAVGKKIREKIDHHRAIFVQGAEKRGIDRSVAEAIYGDIEYFARYGFNKAHAADYAVLTCQTAYLKAHYPLEFTWALFQNEIGNLEKIAVLVAESRRIGIPILPPDVRFSDVGFMIDEDQKGIRFGLSAIKNVGAGAVELIVKARQEGGPFKTLDEFCRRVDLRQINRRVLESLIKAGAFIGFGHREQLLKVIDRMISTSALAHNASALGQMTFFGTALQSDSFGELPSVPDLDLREKLELEKELMGVYFSEHPLLRVIELGSQYATSFVGELTEEQEGHVVTLGGIITSVRIITTKKGDPMAFIQLEDPQGTIEVTAFPRTFAAARELIVEDALVMVKGKLQLRESKITLLADSIQKHPITASKDSRDPTVSVQQPESVGPLSMTPEPSQATAVPPISERPQPSSAGSPLGGRGYGDDRGLDDWVPEPEDLDLDAPLREGLSSPVRAVSKESSEGETEPNYVLPTLNLGSGIMIPSKSNGVNDTEERDPGNLTSAQNGGSPLTPDAEETNEGAALAQSSNAHESVPLYATPGQGARLVRVRIQRSKDSETDIERMRDLVKLLRSVKGRDRFSLVVPNVTGMVLLDFPNFYTDYDLVADPLTEMIAGWAELELG